MKQVAALAASRNQYDQVTSVMPQLSAEISTLQWLYSVMNKGERAMSIMNMNIPERAKAGGIEGMDLEPVTLPMPPAVEQVLPKLGKRRRYVSNGVLQPDKPVDYAALNEQVATGNIASLNQADNIRENAQMNMLQTPAKMPRVPVRTGPAQPLNPVFEAEREDGASSS